ncbi:SRPBCC domain-containing protein [Mycobacterium xenopi]|uniref:SRPBCC family protein n=1 Tax=Mycobacterium xenopi TaxID=1789 RepID=UPI0022EA23CC|nr:SRPBCC domain-containing protein [Mycobacterium xenopi]MDA3660943.1 SRPBCC domain-containing protein [Mycobacterium xenopi]
MIRTADPTVIEVDQFYPHPPERVWQALTTPELMARWLMAPSGFAPVVGTRFTFQGQPMPSVGFSGEVACEVLAVVPGQRLAMSWADARSDKPSAWVGTWTLHPEGSGTRVILRHTGFDPDDDRQQRARTIMGQGWVRIVAQLGRLLDD